MSRAILCKYDKGTSVIKFQDLIVQVFDNLIYNDYSNLSTKCVLV